MNNYTLQSCTPLGDRDPKYGQTYWAEALESDLPIMFNSMSEDAITAGQKISFESMTPAKSKKGTNYMRLKKVRVLTTTTSGPAVVNADEDRIGYIVEMLEELTGRKETVIEPDDDLEEVPFE